MRTISYFPAVTLCPMGNPLQVIMPGDIVYRWPGYDSLNRCEFSGTTATVRVLIADDGAKIAVKTQKPTPILDRQRCQVYDECGKPVFSGYDLNYNFDNEKEAARYRAFYPELAHGFYSVEGNNCQPALLIMPYFSGRHFLDCNFSGNLKTAMYFYILLLKCVQQLHETGWVHCDINKSNVLITDEGQVRLIDFAMAQKKNDWVMQLYSLMPGEDSGSFPQTDPVLFSSRRIKITPAIDIYSLGYFFWKLFCIKRFALSSEQNQVIGKLYSSMRELHPEKRINISYTIAALNLAFIKPTFCWHPNGLTAQALVFHIVHLFNALHVPKWWWDDPNKRTSKRNLLLGCLKVCDDDTQDSQEKITMVRSFLKDLSIIDGSDNKVRSALNNMLVALQQPSSPIFFRRNSLMHAGQHFHNVPCH